MAGEETHTISKEVSSPVIQKSISYIPVLNIVNFTLVTILPPILVVVGMLGNILSFLLMNQSKYSKSTTCFYMRCLAISDSAYIFGRMIQRYLLVVASNILLEPSIKTYFCLFYFAMFHFGLILSPLLLTVMAIDRFVALTWPLKAATVCTMRRSKQLVFVIISLGTVLGCAQLFRSYHEDLRSWYCTYHFIGHLVFDQVFNAIIIYIPFVCLLICNIGIIRAIFISARDTSLSRRKRPSSIETSITNTTLMVTCIFIISIIPNRFEQLFWLYLNYDPSSELIFHIQVLTANFAIFMESLNYCLNFYMYVLSCKRFRKELLIIITGRYETLRKSTQLFSH
ncbi:G-protein coupled receptor 183-A-like [Lineus longissimus]|uniref:G-protein coupled receptor 183-A-like n=1 Tax=Lineus longissimus TaxID=88925 RepID=UPI00315D00A0